MKKILSFFLLLSFCLGERIIITHDGAQGFHGPDLPDNNIKLKLVAPGGTIKEIPAKSGNIEMFTGFPRPAPKPGRQNLRILVLKVEFVEDDDTTTTGIGKMDLLGYGRPEDGLFYDPPHTKNYFERQMQFLSNFYKVNSFGHCNVEYVVKPDKPTENYQLPHKMKYYSGFERLEYVGEYIFAVYNTYAMEMGMVRIVADAIAAADQDASINFSQYDNIVVFHAGTMWQISANFLRFHDIPSATIPPPAFEYYLGRSFFVVDNGSDTIECSVSLLSEMARVENFFNSSLGTAVHEFAHILGIPDLYDYTYYSSGVGAWDLMGFGGWAGNPAVGAPSGSLPTNLSAWQRYNMGWVNPVIYTNPETLLTLRASEIDTSQYNVANQTMIKIPISPNEYFLLENRQHDIKHKDTVIVDVEDGVPIFVDNGEFDFFLPGSGILIWHIDDRVIMSEDFFQDNPKHKGVDLEEADGIQHFDGYWNVDSLETYGSAYDAYFVDDSGKASRHFGTFTKPNSDSYYGKSFIDIMVNSRPDTLMNFSLDFDIYQDGFPVTVRANNAIQATTYGDVDGNGDREIITFTKTGYIYIFNHDGTLYTSRYFGQITTFPAIGDIDGDGADDIAFGSDQRLFCLSGTDLDTLTGFPFMSGDAIVGAPLMFDLNADGNLEIIFGSRDRQLYCLNNNGGNIPGFPLFLNTEIPSTPCVFDKDNRQIGVLGSDGRFWLVGNSGIIKEFTNSQHNLISYSSPVVGDMDRDGFPEAIIINGNGTVYIFGKDSLEAKFEIYIDTTMYFTPALADLDKDGYLEIIAPSSSRTLFVCNRNGTSENNYPLFTEPLITYPLLIADIDTTDGNKEEIIYGLGPVDSIGSGTLELINDRMQKSKYSPLYGQGGFTSPGVIFDLDYDGDLEIACGSDAGKLYVWDFPITKSSWTGYMNSTKNWGIFDGELASIPVAQGLLGNCYIYPSPVTRQGTVRFYLYENADVLVDILDIAGRRMGGINVPFTTAREYNEVSFDFSNKANGVYLVRIEATTPNGIKEIKFKKFAILK